MDGWEYKTCFSSHALNGGQFNPWWEVDLGQDYAIQTVEILRHNHPAVQSPQWDHGFDVLVDNVNCATSVTVPATGWDTGVWVTTPCVSTGRVVRILIPSPGTNPSTDRRTLTLCGVKVMAQTDGNGNPYVPATPNPNAVFGSKCHN
jgi:hypothetical protein